MCESCSQAWTFDDLTLYNVRIRPVYHFERLYMLDPPARTQWYGEDAPRYHALQDAVEFIEAKSDFIGKFMFQRQLVEITLKVTNNSRTATGEYRLDWTGGLPLYQYAAGQRKGEAITPNDLRAIQVITEGRLMPQESRDVPMYILTSEGNERVIRMRALGDHLGGAQDIELSLEGVSDGRKSGVVG